ncbi:tRNA (guanosine(46)-N7)-methyltransferase TrmB [Thermosulfurimonas marina]|uniref:tRNA (guanine-N(7)-)-methyltransferase n=1 Tax=Thermosulfurimonas marina TaxID=2047767 RepID=A0A6H1WQJ2_9BACT|nr:tRNA (guanosine(46)-N7)-methyltransferase TrmB [Thermosulfurimonas marina]QJA05424.1 tRNA (guanosine(46)-N7)-methyltransferase TrmB [Thermosulfurimonas marina]
MQGYLNYKRIEKPLRLWPLSVEIGFGNGEFLVRLAREHPEHYFLGIELSGISIEKLLKRIRDLGLTNLFCVRLDAYWAFWFLLSDESVETIYLNYPDPWFKKRHHRRRLTRPDRLWLLARRLRTGGEIRLRTDDRPFLDYTLEVAESLGAFEIRLTEIRPEAPLTKYEAKWLSEGKTLYALSLKKVRPPAEVPHPEIEEVKELFPVRVAHLERLPEVLQRVFRLREGLVLKIFRAWEHGEDRLLEALLAEEDYTQQFMIFIRKRRQGDYLMDVSPFSEVLKTRGLQEALEFLGKELSK